MLASCFYSAACWHAVATPLFRDPPLVPPSLRKTDRAIAVFIGGKSASAKAVNGRCS
jgi:hypothetical protein